MATEFYLGVDVVAENEGGTVTASLVEKFAEDVDAEPAYRLHHLAQYDEDEGTEAPADRIQATINEAPFTGVTTIVVNKTSTEGKALVEELVRRGLTPIGVELSGGDAATQLDTGLARTSGGDVTEDVSGFLVSEHELVHVLNQLFRSGRLRLELDKTDRASRLAQGLQDYEARAPEPGEAEALEETDALPGRRAEHAALVLSTALACWLGEQRTFDPGEALDETAQAIEEQRGEEAEAVEE